MRIDELTGVKYDTRNPHDRLLDKGFHPVGQGQQATVYSHPGFNYVLKVFNSKDTPYQQFLDIALKNQSNEHFPRIIGRPVRINDMYRAIRMEKLDPTPYTFSLGGDRYSIYSLYADEKLMPDPQRTKLIAKLEPEVLDQYKNVGEKFPEFIMALKIIMRNLGNKVNDLHADNIMVRNKSVPVIIDPYTFGGKVWR